MSTGGARTFAQRAAHRPDARDGLKEFEFAIQELANVIEQQAQQIRNLEQRVQQLENRRP